MSYGKKPWKVDVDVLIGEGPSFMTITFEPIISTSEDGAKKQVRSRLRKQGLKTRLSKYRPVRATRIYTEIEKMRIEARNVFNSVDGNRAFYDITRTISSSNSKIIMKERIMKQLKEYQKPLTIMKKAFNIFFKEE